MKVEIDWPDGSAFVIDAVKLQLIGWVAPDRCTFRITDANRNGVDFETTSSVGPRVGEYFPLEEIFERDENE